MAISEQEISEIVHSIILQMSSTPTVPVESSARHVHLSQSDVEKLFGHGHQLTPKKELSQPGQYLCEERITLAGPASSFYQVAVLGPVRPETQVEISRTDARTLKLNAPIRESGDIAGSPGLVIIGSNGSVVINEGVIIARNHIHMTPNDAQRLSVKDKQLVSTRINSDRPVTFHNVVVRVKESFRLAMHIDFDEANAIELGSNALAELIID